MGKTTPNTARKTLFSAHGLTKCLHRNYNSALVGMVPASISLNRTRKYANYQPIGTQRPSKAR
ncbi:hypothetical protein, partial [Neisseria dentiae]|uniref:hypothetical protein n=1 Tax=Neisseria dentiae TaxID=194197 RepID=UPI0035A0CF86